jgi:predicted nuclease of predicted toxin-antitoxin system
MISWFAERGHDAVHAAGIGLAVEADSAILERGRNEGRVIVTADLDYPRLLALSGAKGPGVILFRGGDFSGEECIEGLARAFSAIPEEELLSSIIVIEPNRVRRRRLPIE